MRKRKNNINYPLLSVKYLLMSLATVILLYPLHSAAQTPPATRVTVRLQDSAGAPVEGAVISLFTAKDTQRVKTSVSGADGMADLSVPSGVTYVLEITHVAYEKYSGRPFTAGTGGERVALPAIILKKASGQLNTITVQARKPFVEVKSDKTVVNVDALISNAGRNVLEVLQQSPGIAVDENGGISLKGKTGVNVLIDDKPHYLPDGDLANYLRSLPAGSVDIIEIMTNPPARYDAAGNAGIVNIRLKKTKAKGLNGGISTSYGQGFYARTNNSFNFNYRINKINYFGNFSYNNNNTYQDLTIRRTYYKQTGALSSAFNQHSFIKSRPSGLNARVGMDYYRNKQSTFGIVLSGFNNISRQAVRNDATLSDSAARLQNIVFATALSRKEIKNKGINLNYAFKPDSTARELTVHIDYLTYSSTLGSSLLNQIYLPDQSFVSESNLIGQLPSGIHISTAKLDYILPSREGERLDFGIKGSFIRTNNTAGFFDEDNGMLKPNDDFSNNFRYREAIQAAYTNYSLERDRYTLQAGLRFENTVLSGRQSGSRVRPDSSFRRHFSNLFPTFYFQYRLDSLDKHQVGFSYGRRIDRPDYQSMNPFTYPLDRYTLYGGNPFLRPTFSHNLELTHSFRQRVNTTFQYSYTRDVISETIEQGDNIFFSRPGNLGRQISYGVSVNATIQPFPWWTVQLYSEWIHNKFVSRLYGQEVNNAGTHWVINGSNQFAITKQWSAELSGSYQTRVYYAQFVLIPVGSLTTAVSRRIMKDKVTVKAGLTDIFYTSQRGGDIKSLANSTASWYSYFDSRVVSLSLSYRFNKGKSLKAREIHSADSEKERVKLG